MPAWTRCPADLKRETIIHPIPWAKRSDGQSASWVGSAGWLFKFSVIIETKCPRNRPPSIHLGVNRGSNGARQQVASANGTGEVTSRLCQIWRSCANSAADGKRLPAGGKTARRAPAIGPGFGPASAPASGRRNLRTPDCILSKVDPMVTQPSTKIRLSLAKYKVQKSQIR